MSDKKYCCDIMEDQLTHKCEQCGDGPACGDVVVSISNSQGSKGKLMLIARNAEYICNFCPWCGTKWKGGKR